MDSNETFVHPSAVVHSKARLGTGVYVGPGSYVGEKVTINKNTRMDGNVWITGRTEIGKDCRFSPFSAIGTEPQDITYAGEDTLLRIGDRNVFREFMTIHRGTVKGGGKTVIGSDNYFMAYSHVAHDCDVGNGIIFTHAATIGGHVTVGDGANVGAATGVHQFCRIGRHSFIGGYSTITQDVLPFSKVAGGRPTLLYGLNAVGLKRMGYEKERISVLKHIFKIFFYSELNSLQALERIEKEIPPGEDRDEILRFVRTTKRGIVKKPSEKWEKDSE